MALTPTASRRPAVWTLVVASTLAVGIGVAPPALGQFTLPGTTPPSGGAAPATAGTPAPNPTPRALRQTQPPTADTSGASGRITAGGSLPRDAGQEHRVYDLRPYTGYLTRMDHPEQAVVDWILRETGSDVWFTQPFGFLNADRDSLSVYHTREMHEVVAGVVERFVAGEKDPQNLHLRVMTVGNPDWRARAHPFMQHVNVESPGIQAWLMSKENAAIVLSLLRARNDARQVQELSLAMHNGQTERLTSTRGKNYVRNVRPASVAWPPYEPETGEIQEGYRLSLSSLLSTDGRALDCVIKADIDQVDKFNHVNLELPLASGETHRTRIDVPQVVSWRLHERFRWPSDQVLLLSCGVVASPEREARGLGRMNLSMITGSTPGRADALLFVEHRGRATENLTTLPAAPAGAPSVARVPGANRGRY